MNTCEELAVLTAMQKVVKARLDEVRSHANAELRASWDDDGVAKKALRLGGVKVGDFTVVLDSEEWEVSDRREFEDFALAYGFARPACRIKPDWMARAVEIMDLLEPEGIDRFVEIDPKWQRYITNTGGQPTFLDSGLEVPGLNWRGQRVKCTQVRGCEPDKVVPIVRGLGGVERVLLGDADEDAAG